MMLQSHNFNTALGYGANNMNLIIFSGILFVIILLLIGVVIFLQNYQKEKDKKSYLYQHMLQQTSRTISSTIEHKKILDLITEFATLTIGINNISLINYNKSNYTFNEVGKPKGDWVLKIDHPLIRLLKKIQTPFFANDIIKWQKNNDFIKELNAINISNSDLEIIKRNLKSQNLIAAFPLIANRQLVGVLAIGEKKNKKPYSSYDIKLLNTLIHQIATATENANLYQDIKNSEKMFKQQRDQIQSIINNLTDGLIVINNNRNVILANPVAQRLFPHQRLIGEELPEILKQTINEKNAIKQISQITNRQQTKCEVKFPLITDTALNTHKMIDLRIITNPLFDETEKQIGYIKILHDITRDKEIDKIKSDFIRTAAHKLRTPLSATKWIFKMMIDGDLGEIPPRQKEFLEKGYQSNERMVRVVNDLLNVSEIEEGKFNFHFEKISIIDIIEEVIKELESLAQEKNQEFTYNLDKTIGALKVDRYKLKMAIAALVLNSVQYTKKGGRINIKLEKMDQEIKFTITDNGYGIPNPQQDKIFTKFMRGDNIVQIETEGNGLGLYIAKNIIKGHKGKIGFKSEQDKGTEFYFTLPLN